MKGTGQKAMVVVVMGVSGVGKTTIGKLLAEQLGWSFFDADDFHPEDNVTKMSRGIALADADRQPWLKALNKLIEECLAEGCPAVLACSALRASYRDVLKKGNEAGLRFVFLTAPADVIQERLDRRTGHYMPPTLLASQLQTLEIPKDAIHVNAEGAPPDIVAQVREELAV